MIRKDKCVLCGMMIGEQYICKESYQFGRWTLCCDCNEEVKKRKNPDNWIKKVLEETRFKGGLWRSGEKM